MIIIKKTNHAGEEAGQVKSFYHFGGLQTGVATIEVSMNISQKTEYNPAIWPRYYVPPEYLAKEL